MGGAHCGFSIPSWMSTSSSTGPGYRACFQMCARGMVRMVPVAFGVHRDQPWADLSSDLMLDSIRVWLQTNRLCFSVLLMVRVRWANLSWCCKLANDACHQGVAEVACQLRAIYSVAKALLTQSPEDNSTDNDTSYTLLSATNVLQILGHVTLCAVSYHV